MSIKYFFLIPLLLWLGTLPGQSEPRQPSLHFLALDESFALPGLDFATYSYQPAFQLGAELPLNRMARSGWHLSTNLGFYFHRHTRTAGFLNIRIGYRLRLGRFHLGLNAGPGAALAYTTHPVYVFDEGIYRPEGNNGQLVFMPGATLGLGYRLGPDPTSPELLVHYEFALDQPFTELPVPHVFAGVGVRVYPF